MSGWDQQFDISSAEYDRVKIEKEPNRNLWFIVADGCRVGAVSNRKEAEVLASNARRRIKLEEDQQ